jgi:hypothetical protein
MAVSATTAQSIGLDVSTKQLSDQNSVGTLLGASPTDKIGFFGVATPVAQRAAGSNTAYTSGMTTTVQAAVIAEIQATLIGLGIMPAT